MIKNRMAIIGGATALVLVAGGGAAYAASASIPIRGVRLGLGHPAAC